MATEAQIAANRRNAQLSTGPRTEEGKARAARSSLRHGLTAADLVLFDESEEGFDEFHTGVSRDLEPVGSVECALVERIAFLAWRIRRAGRAEAALINAEAQRRKEQVTTQSPKGMLRIDASLFFDKTTDKINLISRYEAAIERQLNRAIATLDRRQTRRRERAEWQEKRLNEDRPLPEPSSNSLCDWT